jgi:hypothetical protein
VLELSFGVADTSGMFSSSPSRWDDAAVSRAAARRFDLTRSDIFVVLPSFKIVLLTSSVLRVVAVGGLLTVFRLVFSSMFFVLFW